MKRNILAIVAFSSGVWSCSSSSPGDANSPGGTGGSSGVSSGASGASGASGGPSTAGGAGEAGGGGSSGASDTSACPVWPQARLMPDIGAFFYGPDPGPCSDTFKSNQTYVSTYTYQSGKLQSAQETLEGISGGQNTTTYGIDAQGRIESAKTDTETDVFEYAADYLLDTTKSQDGTITRQVRFALSSSGYPTSASLTAAPGSPSLSFRYSYTNCRLVTRASLDASGATLEQLNYTYDAAGHVAARLSSDNFGDIYNYACWQ